MAQRPAPSVFDMQKQFQFKSHLTFSPTLEFIIYSEWQTHNQLLLSGVMTITEHCAVETALHLSQMTESAQIIDCISLVCSCFILHLLRNVVAKFIVLKPKVTTHNITSRFIKLNFALMELQALQCHLHNCIHWFYNQHTKATGVVTRKIWLARTNCINDTWCNWPCW